MKNIFNTFNKVFLCAVVALLLVCSCKPKLTFTDDYILEDNYTVGIIKEIQKSEVRIGVYLYSIESEDYPNLRFNIHSDKKYAIGDSISLRVITATKRDENL